MADALSYSKLGYLMLKKETTAGTAVYPNQPIEILSENIELNWDYSSVSQIAGQRALNQRPVDNKVGPFEGTLELYVEAHNIGHFLNGVFGEDTVTTVAASVSIAHDWEPLTTLPTYTMDIKVAGKGYVTRYFGVVMKKVTFSIDDNKLKASVDISAQRVFDCARVTTAAASGTALVVDQTSGLVAGSDSILVLSQTAPGTTLATLTVTTVTNETTLVVSTIGASLAVNDIVVIAAQTPDVETYDMANEMTWSGGADVYIAAGANALQNLAAKTNCEEFELTIENTIEPRWAATGTDVVDRMPASMLVKGVAVTGKFSQFHINPQFMDYLRNTSQLGLRFRFYGDALASATTAVASAGTIESDGAGTVSVTADTAGEDGNDYAIIVVQGTGALSASISGKLVTVTLSSTPASNAVALVATAVAALTGVGATSASTGNVTIVDNPDKIFFAATGRDASEKEMLRFDMPNARISPFHPSLGEDDTIMEEIEFTAFWDSNDEREILVRLRNDISGY